MTMVAGARTDEQTYDVGGIRLPRPFKVRRLGHFGVNLLDVDAGFHFYCELLGFTPSDTFERPGRKGFFTRYGTDHHAFVFFDREPGPPGAVTTNQITWQVGSLREVADAASYFQEHGVRLHRVGRDMPGSNWHTYLYDPDGHVNELYYGIEQVGWHGHSKPTPMYERGFREAPSLPQLPEYEEVRRAREQGVDLASGFTYQESLPAVYDVDGILMPRPFKIVRIGPVRLFVQDVDAAQAFYQRVMGFTVTEEVLFEGQRCVFLRANTEHHALALYPAALRDRLGLSPHTTLMSFGVQLATYRQLREAIGWLRERGVTVKELPPELSPGIEYSALALDPDGHAVQLYCGMEQIGWDGRPRPAALRRPVARRIADWPEALEPLSDTYGGEPFLGPWA